MKKWSNGAKKRLVEIQAAEDGKNDMHAIASAMAKLPHGLLKKVLTDDVISVLDKYGVTLE